ncbi:MAG: helix-turn-helix domain-containing protein [Planctomycetaceae bacterium]|nr:helix-turn-helix domain-containing protein [Planctomycetaceae bacterium]
MAHWLSPKQVASSIGVSESSLKRWCDRGVLPSSRTAGGHRRLPLAGVIRYLRDQNLDPNRPEILGLPERSAFAFSDPAEAVDALVRRLLSGDFEASRSIMINLFMKGVSIASIGDELVSPAMSSIGSHWEVGDGEVYQERRAVEVVTRVLHEFSRLLPDSDPTGPRAIGGTVEGDQYQIATLLVELTLRERGWNASSLGSNLPFDTLARAASDVNPRLFWLSVSKVRDREAFTQCLNRFQGQLPESTALVLGGNALDSELRKRSCFSACCDDLRQLTRYVATLDQRQ